jgi:hypothetical protein
MMKQVRSIVARVAIKSSKGSTLVYVLVTGIVLTLILAIILSMLTFNQHRTRLQKTHTQAYYTAQTMNERIATWITGIPGLDDEGNGTLPDADADIWTEKADPIAFLANLKTRPDYKIVQENSAEDLGGQVGSATTTIQYRDPGGLSDPAKFRNIRITTKATVAGQTETLSLDMSLQVAQTYSMANTNFEYGTPAIQKILGEIPMLDDWRDGSAGAKRDGSDWNYFDAAGIVTPIENQTIDGITAKFSYMNPLYYTATASTTRNYNMTYIRVNTSGSMVDADLKVCFDYNQGPIRTDGFVPSTYPPTPGYLNDGSLIMFSYGGGATFPPTSANNKTLTYYTSQNSVGTAGMTYPSSITISPYLSGGTTPAAQLFNNFFFYATDLSDAKVRILNGVTVNSGGIYTKRSAEIGATANVLGAPLMLPFTQSNPMVFNNSQMIFADPGESQAQRSSIVQGYNGTTAYVSMSNGNVLVQRRHKLTIGNYVTFACGDEKGITVESGGELVINSGANITSNIYVQNGASLTINGGTITGNIYCSGALIINGSFTQNHLDSNADNIELGYLSTADIKGEQVNLSGIYIYSGDSNAGALTITSTPSVPQISGNGGKIHTFVTPTMTPAVTLSESQSNGLFTSMSDPNSHITKEFETGYFAWMTKQGSNREVTS